MPKTKNKPARIFIAATVLALALVLPLPLQAQASIVGLALDSIFDVILGILGFIVNMVGFVVIGIAASLVNYVFTFQNFVKVPVVQIGWTLSRDLANMVFILIMLAMAFGTILRFESYGWKRLLPRLVLVALLINFSLIIGGAVIDVGNSLGRFFVSGGGENAAVGDFIMASVRAGQLAQLRNENANSAAFSPVTALIMTTVVQLVFYLILAFLLLALGLIMVFRMINLWILLVLAPFAWISYAIPGKSDYWGSWWKKFTTWALFPAYMGFFIFLGLLVGATFSGSPFASSAPDAGGFWSLLFPGTLFSVIMQFIVVVAILFLGLAQAQSLSGAGAKTMMGAVGAMQKWSAGKLKGIGKAAPGTALRLAEKAEETRLGKKILGGKRPVSALERMALSARDKFETAPLIGRAIGGPGARFQAQQKALKDAKGKLQNLRPQDLAAIADQRAITPDDLVRRAAAIAVRADKGKLDDEKDLKHLRTFLNAGGNIKDILQRRPDWAISKQEIQQLLATHESTKKDWGDLANKSVDDNKTRALEIVKSKVFEKSGDMLNIQEEAVRERGTMTDPGYEQYKKDQENNNKEKEKISELINAEFDAAENLIRKIRDDKELSADEQKERAGTAREELKKRSQELQKQIIDIEEKQVGDNNRAQYLLRQMITDEFSETGKLQVGALNSLANTKPTVYLEFTKYLKTHATALKAQGKLKDNVFKHVTSGPMAAIAEETPAAPPAATGATP